jgi:hypothetical protein
MYAILKYGVYDDNHVDGVRLRLCNKGIGINFNVILKYCIHQYNEELHNLLLFT